MKRSRTKKLIPSETLKGVGEFGLLKALRSQLDPHNASVLTGIGDDAAILRPTAGRDLVLTTDMLVEGKHFNFKWTDPWQLGAKTMAVNISDCAAMGARPTVAVVSLGLPKDYPVESTKAFYDGMKSWGQAFGVDIVGGDTVASDSFVVNLAMLGEVEKGQALKRSGAKSGDAILVTGTLGDSAAGLHALSHPTAKGKEVKPLLVNRHVTPVPRFVSGRFLSTHRLATACIDVSDGLSSEVNHLCEESGVGAEIHEEAVPLSAALEVYCADNGLNPLDFALHGGEDYELLFTVPLAKIGEVLRLMPAETGVSVKSVGRITDKKKGVTLIGAKGRKSPFKPQGFDHFK